MYVTTPVTYVSSTTMILTTTEYGGTQSQDPATPSDLINPMLYFNDSLKTTSAILIEAMNTKDVATQLGASGRTTLRVDDGRTNPNLLGLNGPFLYIVGESTSPAEAERVVQEAQTLMREKLRDWQSALRAPERTFVTLVDVVPPSTPEPNRGRATKLGLMAFIFGLGLSLAIAYLRHRTRDRRRARAVAPAFGRRPAAVGGPSQSTPRLASVALPGPGSGRGGRRSRPSSRWPRRRPSRPRSRWPRRPAARVPEQPPVPVTKKKNETGRVPTSQQQNETVPVATPTKKNGTAPVPTSQQKVNRSVRRPREERDGPGSGVPEEDRAGSRPEVDEEEGRTGRRSADKAGQTRGTSSDEVPAPLPSRPTSRRPSRPSSRCP